jgi:hypothetical protein
MASQVARQSPTVLRRDATNQVERVADKRMPGRNEVDSNLAQTARCDPDLKQGTVITPFKNSKGARIQFCLSIAIIIQFQEFWEFFICGICVVLVFRVHLSDSPRPAAECEVISAQVLLARMGAGGCFEGTPGKNARQLPPTSTAKQMLSNIFL